MDSRRIRRVRKPTAWELWVARWHAWLEDTLERAVRCGVDPEATRFSVGSKQASAAFSIRSMGAYLDDSEFENYEDACEVLSDTESESTDDHLSDSLAVSIDMERRYSAVDDYDEAWERRRTSVSSEYVPFGDEEQEASVTRRTLGDEDDTQELEANQVAGLCERDALHRCYFNCVLAELLMTSHPVGLWIDTRD